MSDLMKRLRAQQNYQVTDLIAAANSYKSRVEVLEKRVEALEAALRISRVVLIERGLYRQSRIIREIDTALKPEQDK
jgi:hypothetical protein